VAETKSGEHVSAHDDQTLRILLERARAAVGAGAGWIVATQPDGARVIVVAGDTGGLEAGAFAQGGSASYVASSGQPLALAPRSGDPFVEQGVSAMLGRTPSSLMSLPCVYSDDVVGAIELVDKDGGGRFSLDDLEIAGAFADIAGPALAAADLHIAEVTSPEQFAAELRRLELDDPVRYRLVAWAVAALLAGG